MKSTQKTIIAIFSIVALVGAILIFNAKKQVGVPNSNNPSQEISLDISGQTREIIDGQGKKIAIPAKIERIAAAGALNQIVFMLGGGDKLVATAQGVQKGFFTTVYPRIKEIPAAYTGPGPGVLSMETLLQTNPQIVFGTAASEKEAQILAAAGIVSISLKLNTPADIKNTILMVGKVIGSEAEKKAVEFNKYYDENIEYAANTVKSVPKVKVFTASSDGGSGPVSTVPGNDILTSYIEAAGGVNIAAVKLPAALADGSSMVDFEFLNVEQPDVIIAQSRQIYDYITDTFNNSQWQHLSAVKNKKVYINPKGVYLWSVRSAEGALEPLWLVKILHPELTADLDIAQKIREFYKTNYYYDLNLQEIDSILYPEQ
jgi:iron complex transport system substrate-binding protein